MRPNVITNPKIPIRRRLTSFFGVRVWRGVCFLSDGVGLAFGCVWLLSEGTSFQDLAFGFCTRWMSRFLQKHNKRVPNPSKPLLNLLSSWCCRQTWRPSRHLPPKQVLTEFIPQINLGPPWFQARFSLYNGEGLATSRVNFSLSVRYKKNPGPSKCPSRRR